MRNNQHLKNINYYYYYYLVPGQHQAWSELVVEGSCFLTEAPLQGGRPPEAICAASLPSLCSAATDE